MDKDLNRSSDEREIINSEIILSDVEQQSLTRRTQLEDDDMENTDLSANKRSREQDSSEIWHLVSRSAKKQYKNKETTHSQADCTQICVTCKSKFPKQFTLAKLLRNNDISGVSRIKYVNPFKILIDFEKDLSADQFIACEHFKELGWKCQKTWEVGFSYGVIKDIELDKSEDELIKYMASNVEIANIKRLKRRNEEGWTLSESVRIGFIGSTLPPFIYLFDVKIKVEPFVFPVTQCSRCWRYGHVKNMCPSNRSICPKCAKAHPNCETSINEYKCVNCQGNHMALSKTCPEYAKEKKIRQLMSEFNVTYQKAMSLYVPPSPYEMSTHKQDEHHNTEHLQNETESTNKHVYTPTFPLSSNATYAEIAVRNSSSRKQDQKGNTNRTEQKKKKEKTRRQEPFIFEGEGRMYGGRMDHGPYDYNNEEEIQSEYSWEGEKEREEGDRKKSVGYQELLMKLKHVILVEKMSITSKIHMIGQIILDWFISFAVGFVADLPILKKIFDSING